MRLVQFCQMLLRTHGPAVGFRPLSGVGVLVLGSCLLTAAGCTPGRDQFIQFARSYEQVVSAGEYRVAPPDRLTIHAPVSPEIDQTTQRVRPDGKISLRLLGEVHVAGLTTQEIAAKVTQQLSRYYQDPEVVVDVAEYRSKFYFVFGEVRAPGPQPYTGRDTLLKALAQAQPNEFAWRSQIRITRPSAAEGDRATVVVDLDHLIRSAEVDQDVLLQAGDIVEVPPTPVAWVGHQVRALLYPVTPIVQAYNMPASAVESYDTYHGRNDSNNDDSNGLRFK